MDSSPQIQVSLIVPVYNNLQGVIRCIQWIAQQAMQIPMEVILSDDASTEFNLLEMFQQPWIVQRNQSNLGFAGNCNVAAKRASAPYLCFVNSDIEGHPHSSIGNMIKAFDSLPNIGVVGPKLLFPQGTVQSCGGYYDVGKGPYHRYLNFQSDYDPACTSGVVPWITGALMMTPRSLFQQLGGFDEGYKRGYFEDVDYCERVKQAGFCVWYDAAQFSLIV